MNESNWEAAHADATAPEAEQTYEFQTPCGDVGVSGPLKSVIVRITSPFQTPCGDVGVSGPT